MQDTHKPNFLTDYSFLSLTQINNIVFNNNKNILYLAVSSVS